MADSTLGAEFAPVATAPFNPADWLARFREAGGWWVIGCDDRLSYGVPEEAQSLLIYGEIEHDPSKRAAVKAHLLSISVQEADHGRD